MPPRWTLSAGCVLALACATPTPSSHYRYDFFAEVQAPDSWSERIVDWQRRARHERRELRERSSDAWGDESELLSEKLDAFEGRQRRELAHRINAWAQYEARHHYQIEDDSNPEREHWPTFGELLENDGDDCDGLDLMAYQLLLDFGFPPQELFRAIVKRKRDGVNHMVTLWFESQEDPWVLDATGAMTLQMKRFSTIVGWTPTRMFNERVEFVVGERASFAGE